MLKRFDYKCTECYHIEEHWTHSEDYVSCLECGETAKRIISPIRTHYKGTGWPDADERWAKDHERAALK